MTVSPDGEKLSHDFYKRKLITSTNISYAYKRFDKISTPPYALLEFKIGFKINRNRRARVAHNETKDGNMVSIYSKIEFCII